LNISLRSLLVTACVASAALALSNNQAHAGLAAVPIPAPYGFNSANAGGLVGGGHAGYNWQQGQFVFGFETDLQATDLRSQMNDHLIMPGGGALPAGSFANTTASIDWYGTVRGRFGFATGPWLFFGTGGFAYGGVGLTSNFGTFGLTTNLLSSQVRTGWVGGVGVEYLWRPNVSFNLTYQYVDLGSLSGFSSTTVTGCCGIFATVAQAASMHAQFQTVMAGFSWHFAPAPSGPWAGWYAGGHLGGAWGDNASAAYSSAAAIPIVSDSRLKRDIALIGRRDDGLGIYSYKYLWSDVTYVGVMAQEVALIHPEAVVRDALSGYLAVDYGRLGLSLMTLRRVRERL
jgi:outer membrane immunogenic protein